MALEESPTIPLIALVSYKSEIAGGVAVVAVGEALVGGEVDVVGNKADRAVGEGDLDAARMRRNERRVAENGVHVGRDTFGIGRVAEGGRAKGAHVGGAAVGVVGTGGGGRAVDVGNARVLDTHPGAALRERIAIDLFLARDPVGLLAEHHRV